MSAQIINLSDVRERRERERNRQLVEVWVMGGPLSWVALFRWFWGV